MSERARRTSIVAAKVVLGAVAALVIASRELAQSRSWPDALGSAVAGMALLLGGYELAAHALAWAFRWLWPAREAGPAGSEPAPPVEPPGSEALEPAPPGGSADDGLSGVLPAPPAPPIVEPVRAPPAAPLRFGLADGLVCTGLVLAAQVAVWVVASPVAHGAGRTAARLGAMRAVSAALLLQMSAGALVAAFALHRFGLRYPAAVLREDVGLAWGSRRANWLGFGSGLGLAVLFPVFVAVFAPNVTAHASSLDQLMTRSLEVRLSWSLAAVLLAGPLEEVVYRGVLLGALSSRLSVPVAGLAAGFVFWLLHLPETIGYWPAALFIALLAAVTTIARLRSRALGPAIAVHVGYNLLIASAALLGGR